VGEYGGAVAFPYFNGSAWYLHVEDSTGAHNYLIPGGPFINQQDAKIVMVSTTEVWIAFGIPISLNRYQIVDGSLQRVSSTTVGNVNSRLLDFIHLTSGKLVVVWYQHENLSAGGVNIDFAYLNGLGNWMTLPYTFLSPCTVPSNGTLIQHPADGSIWFFHTADGASKVRAIHLIESGDQIAVDWVDNAFIPYIAGNPMTPEGEMPWIVSAADPSTGSIILAYHNLNYKLFGSNPSVKGANIAVVKVKADKTKSLMFVLNKWVERVTPFSLGVVDGQVWLSYGQIDPVNLTWNELYVTRNNNTSTQLLGILEYATKTSPYLYLSNSANWIIGQMQDGQISFYER